MASVNCLYAAHYSDCEHQLKEVTSGHRLALVYSLCWRGAGVAPSADRITCAANTLQELLSRYAAATPHQSRICWALEHLYSEKSLYTSGFAALKGQDRKIVDMILTATSQLHLSHVPIQGKKFPHHRSQKLQSFGEVSCDSLYKPSLG